MTSKQRIERVRATPEASALIAQLRERHGAIVFHLSHGCCDGSTPMCLAPGELLMNSEDRRLGEVAGAPFYASRQQTEYLANLEITLGVAPGNAGNFSLEDGSGQRFTTALRLWSDEEIAVLAAQDAAQA